MKNWIKTISFLFIGLLFLSACKKDEPPTINFTYKVSGHNVSFTAIATNATVYSWDFGDGKSITEMNPTHTYAAGGEYKVKCTVSGDGGSADLTQTVAVDYSDTELLAGQTPEGKKWKISSAATGKELEILDMNQNGKLDSTGFPAQFLAIMQLVEEYSDEFTLKPDGTILYDNKSGKSFGSISTAMQVLNLPDSAAFAEAVKSGSVKIPLNIDNLQPTTDYGFCSFNNTTAAGTWEVSSEDITINGDYAALQLARTYSGEKHIKFGNANSFFGFYNKTNNRARIKALTADKLTLEFFIDSYEDIPNIGTLLLTERTFELSFVPVEN